MLCPCGTTKTLADCCGPFLEGLKLPETAEALMRSRYTAFSKGDVDYIEKTIAPEALDDFNVDENKEWTKQATFKKLKVLKTERGGPNDSRGTVEFVATYSQNGQGVDHHEVARFRKNGKGQWLFCESHSHTHREGEGHHHAPQAPMVREGPKTGRNNPCPCGSGKKFKKCCG